MLETVCGLDLETTGLDLKEDQIVELAWVITPVGHLRPLVARSEIMRWPHLREIPERVSKINGLTTETVNLHGKCATAVVAEFLSDLVKYECKTLVAHNGENFDRPMLSRVCPIPDGIHWIDSRADVPYPEDFTSRRLGHLAAEYGFVNPFPHTALSDVFTMLRILFQHDFPTVLARSKEPWVTLRAVVSFDDRQKAKDLRYSWEKAGEQTYPKCWVKRVKAGDVEREKQAAADAGVQIGVI